MSPNLCLCLVFPPVHLPRNDRGKVPNINDSMLAKKRRDCKCVFIITLVCTVQSNILQLLSTVRDLHWRLLPYYSLINWAKPPKTPCIQSRSFSLISPKLTNTMLSLRILKVRCRRTKSARVTP